MLGFRIWLLLDQYWPGRCVSAFSGSRSVLLSLLNAQGIQNRYGEKPREILPSGTFCLYVCKLSRASPAAETSPSANQWTYQSNPIQPFGIFSS
ncbi:hypothetical protein QC761_706320 [Podospora bellae-mahoneyi]|uniref:Secreted protein n=1 Tax=Podospora bellae-mahoneyi TaxID=2093777 RepID=A0ABR0F5L5_9PEZI|nr:hypothetical protein QC761_706320 [Podospora bellae-mahoneyi]